MSTWAFLLDLTLPFYFPALPSRPLIFFRQFLKFVVNLHTPPNESMDSFDEFPPSPPGCEPNAYDFKETSVESLHGAPGTRHPLFSDKVSTADAEYVWRRTRGYASRSSPELHSHHLSNEKTCLSVCRRRQCPIERGDPLETERGDPLSKETGKHRLGLSSTNKKSKFLQSAHGKN